MIDIEAPRRRSRRGRSRAEDLDKREAAYYFCPGFPLARDRRFGTWVLAGAIGRSSTAGQPKRPHLVGWPRAYGAEGNSVALEVFELTPAMSEIIDEQNGFHGQKWVKSKPTFWATQFRLPARLGQLRVSGIEVIALDHGPELLRVSISCRHSFYFRITLELAE